MQVTRDAAGNTLWGRCQHPPLPPRLAPLRIVGLLGSGPGCAPPGVCCCCLLLRRQRRLRGLQRLGLLRRRCRVGASGWRHGRLLAATAGGCCQRLVQLGRGLWPGQAGGALCAGTLPYWPPRLPPAAPLALGGGGAAAPGEEPAQEAIARGPLRQPARLLLRDASASCVGRAAAKPGSVERLVQRRRWRRRRPALGAAWAAGIHQTPCAAAFPASRASAAAGRAARQPLL